MLIDIFRMPPVFGIPIDRRVIIHSGEQPPPMDEHKVLHWPFVPLYHENVTVGSWIDRVPNNVYKAVYVSQNEKWVFETVFAMEDKSHCVCIYTKVISPFDVGIAISLNAIAQYQIDRPQLLPISHFLRRNDHLSSLFDHYETALTTALDTNDCIVPPIFGERNLGKYLSLLSDTNRQTVYGSQDVDVAHLLYRPIYDHEPSVYAALVEGWFRQSPFGQIAGRHPLVDIRKDQFFNYEEIHYMAAARGFLCHINHEAFDSITLEILQLLPTKLSVMSTIPHALDELRELWLIKECTDSYQGLLRGMTVDELHYKREISRILHQCVVIYCQLYSLDSEDFLNNPRDQSTISITKNIYDEVSITINDLVTDRRVCFYSSFVSLALSTLSVGWYE